MELTSLLTGAVGGALLGYILFYLSNKASTVPKKVHESLASQLAATSTNLKLSEERLVSLQTQASALQQKAEKKESEISVLISRTAGLEAESRLQHDRLREMQQSLSMQNEVNQQQQTDLIRHQKQFAEMAAQHNALLDKLATQKSDFEALQNTAHLQFEKLAQQIFEEKSGKFTEANKHNIEALLKPLHENIDTFKRKVEETYDKESKQRFSLEKEVKNLIENTQRISQEANNLASALKGQIKKQGDWGETILERILEMSGLEKNREYFVQETFKDEDGHQVRPDVIVRLPDDRNIVIDSKVSLNAYLRYADTDVREEQDIYIAQHLSAINTHIDQLSAKRYNELTNSLDYTIMFVPIEPAYILAVQSDPQLWAAAYAKKIVMISPSTLIATLKIVADLWKRELQNKNAIEIARQGASLYEKFVRFTESLEDIGKHINRTQDFYHKAMGQLKEGRGNLIDQAEKLKKLGIKTTKQLGPSRYSQDDSDQGHDDNPEPPLAEDNMQ
jgi:DNA recombination protein RmuC